MKTHRYFVSYSFQMDGGGTGYGNTSTEVDGPITMLVQIRLMEAEIRTRVERQKPELGPLSGVVIENFILLGKG